MTEQQAIELIENHGYISDEVKDIVIKALKKQIPKSIVGNEYNPVHVGDTVNGMCPECMSNFVCITPKTYKARGFGYCKECGQKMDWEVQNEK